MLAQHPIIVASSICALAAAFEGLCAGRGIRRRLAELGQPRFSPPLAIWIAIGAAYYVTCFIVAYRLLIAPPGQLCMAALILLMKILFTNAIWNYLFFRLRSLRLSFALGVPYTLAAIALLLILFYVDALAAWTFLPYAIYLIYAIVWGYALLRANADEVRARE